MDGFDSHSAEWDPIKKKHSKRKYNPSRISLLFSSNKYLIHKDRTGFCKSNVSQIVIYYEFQTRIMKLGVADQNKHCRRTHFTKPVLLVCSLHHVRR